MGLKEERRCWGVIVSMKDGEKPSLEQIRALLEGSEAVQFEGKKRREVYDWITRTLRRQDWRGFCCRLRVTEYTADDGSLHQHERTARFTSWNRNKLLLENGSTRHCGKASGRSRRSILLPMAMPFHDSNECQ